MKDCQLPQDDKNVVWKTALKWYFLQGRTTGEGPAEAKPRKVLQYRRQFEHILEIILKWCHYIGLYTSLTKPIRDPYTRNVPQKCVLRIWFYFFVCFFLRGGFLVLPLPGSGFEVDAILIKPHDDLYRQYAAIWNLSSAHIQIVKSSSMVLHATEKDLALLWSYTELKMCIRRIH